MRSAVGFVVVGVVLFGSVVGAQPIDAPSVIEDAAPESMDQGWFAQVQEGIRDAEYHFRLGPASYRPGRGEIYQAPNRALDLRIYFDDEGIEILERTAEDAPTVLRLSLEGWALREDDGRMERLRGVLTETYDNTAAGIELGWEIVARPEGDGALVLILDLADTSARKRGGGVEIVSTSGRRLLLQAPRAEDSEGANVPAEFVVVRRDRIEVRVDDAGTVYPLVLKTLLTGTADAILEGNQSWTNMGYSVASAGDINGDGYSDVIVGAPDYDNGQPHEGAAFIFLGSTSGLVGSTPTDADAVLESDQGDAILGWSVGTAGDVNGDGFSDVIVGAKYFHNGQSSEGAAFVFLGSATGIVGSNPSDAASIVESNQVNAYLGWSVGTAGDVNGDGFSDVIVGAKNFHNGHYREGAAFVFLGSASGIVGSNPSDADAVLESDQTEAYLGWSVGTAGDVNGDGFSDVIVGAKNYDNDETDEGAAFVFLGSASGIVGSNPSDAHAVLESNQANVDLGTSVSTADDVNGDGFSDVIIGAPYYNNKGAAFVFLGSSSGITGSNPSDAHAVLESDQFSSLLGTSVSTAGDVNGDGFSDVIVGSDWFTNGQIYEGAAFVFLGSPSGIVGSNPSDAAVMLESNQDGALLGRSVSTAGDVNGDGFADVIAGAPEYDNGGGEEGAAFVFHGSALGLVGSSPADAHASLESDQISAGLGSSASTAGDVNGDGFSDVIVGASTYDNGEADEGAAFVFLGSASGLVGSNPLNADTMLESDQADANLGTVVSTAGDVNGDGYSDVIVGAPYFDNDETNEGAAFVFLGSASGLVGSNPSDAATVLESDQAEAYLGADVGTAGDIDGDGYSDIIVGVPAYDNDETNEGAALVFLGSASGVVGSNPSDADAMLESNLASAALGRSVGTAGDVDGDGFADVIVGADWYADGEAGEGAAFVFLGSASGLVGSSPSDAAAVLESDQENARMGWRAATAGDVNGDGYSDVIVSAPSYDDGESNEGAAFVFHGSALGITGSNPAEADAVLESDQINVYLGYGIGTAGDINGDGFADIIVGTDRYDNGETDEGAAFVFLGSASGIVGSNPSDADAVLESDQAGARLGYSASTAGDVNGDGFADVIVGAPLYDNGEADEGAAFVFLGNSAGRLTAARQLEGPGGAPVRPWGVSGTVDGFAVTMHASSPRGRELVRLRLQACPSGVPLDSTWCATFSGSDWVDSTASADGVELEIEADGLYPGEVYRWRVRTEYLPLGSDRPGVLPLFNPPHGPWRRLGAQAQEADIRILLTADLAVVIDDAQTAAVPGEGVTYTITATNPGTTPVTGAIISDVLPLSLTGAVWTCAGSGGSVCSASGSGDIVDTINLPPGGSVTYTLLATVDPNATGLLSNTVTVSVPGGFVDTSPGDNTATDTDTLTPEADLLITKDDGADRSVLGRVSIYTITAFNPGPSDAANAALIDVFPVELTGITWTCVGSGGGICAAFSRRHGCDPREHGNGAVSGRGHRTEPRRQFGYRHQYSVGGDLLGRLRERQYRGVVVIDGFGGCATRTFRMGTG